MDHAVESTGGIDVSHIGFHPFWFSEGLNHIEPNLHDFGAGPFSLGGIDLGCNELGTGLEGRKDMITANLVKLLCQ
jgi:hypothetical protein